MPGPPTSAAGRCCSGPAKTVFRVFAQSAVASRPRVRRSNNSLISSSLITSGGQSAMRSAGSGAHDQAFLAPRNGGSSAPTCRSAIETRLGLLVGHQFDAARSGRRPWPRPPADDLPAACSRVQEQRRDMAHMTDDVAALIDLDGLERHRRGHRMAAIGEAMAQHADAFAIPGRSISVSSGDSSTAEIGR